MNSESGLLLAVGLAAARDHGNWGADSGVGCAVIMVSFKITGIRVRR
jgi:hypothetical protein